MKLGPVEEPVIAHILTGVLGALEYLHAEDRIHRDLKAANVLISVGGAVKVRLPPRCSDVGEGWGVWLICVSK